MTIYRHAIRCGPTVQATDVKALLTWLMCKLYQLKIINEDISIGDVCMETLGGGDLDPANALVMSVLIDDGKDD